MLGRTAAGHHAQAVMRTFVPAMGGRPALRQDAEPMHAAPTVSYLFFVSAVAPVGFSIVVASLPALADEFRASSTMAFLAMSVFMLVFGLMQLVLGPLSDRYGRRPVLLGGLLAFTAASLWCALAQSIEALLVARMLQAMGGCVALVLPRAMVRDAYAGPVGARAMSVVTMVQSIVPAIAPLVGGALVNAFGWRAVFCFCLAYGLAALAWTSRAGCETLTRGAVPIGPSPRHYLALLRRPRYLAYMLNAALLTVPYVIYLTVAPTLFIRGLGLSAGAFGLYNLLLLVSIAAGSLLAARLAARFSTERLVLWASAAAVASLVLAVLLAQQLSIWRLLGPVLAYCVAHAVLFPLAVGAAIAAYPALAGTASGFIGFAQTGLGALSLMVVGQQGAVNAQFASGVALAAAVAGLGSLALARRGAAPVPARAS